MDPATAIGLAVNVQHLLHGLLEYGKDVKNAKKEIRHLSTEVMMLKAVLEQIKLILNLEPDGDNIDGAASILFTPSLRTAEFRQMLASVENLLEEMQNLLIPEPAGNKHVQVFRTTFRTVMWLLDKRKAGDYINKIERSKSWFILALTTEDNIQCREMYMQICGIEKNINLLVADKEDRKASHVRSSVVVWLAPHNSYEKLMHSLEALQDGTGEWFLNGIYREWMSGSHAPILWFKAKPGFGKTTLVAAAIDRAQKVMALDPKFVVAYSFCSFSDQRSQECRHVLGSLIVQLCENKSTLWQWIDRKYHCRENQAQGHNTEATSIGDLLNLMFGILEQLGPAFLFIDAINEAREPEAMLGILNELARKSKSTRILVSSTAETAIHATDPALSVIDQSSVTFVPIREHTNMEDIQTYIDAELKKRLQLHNLPISLKVEIATALNEKAHGVFRWVQCQLEHLSDTRRTRTIKDVRKALNGLPSTLEQSYEQILKRTVEEGNADLVKSALLWLCFSFRPMRLRELAEAVIVPFDGSEITDDDRLRNPSELLHACSSLVTFYNMDDAGSGYVTLGHSSVREYLTSEKLGSSSESFFYLDPRPSDQLISRLCINYLLQPELSTGACSTYDIYADRLSRLPLLGHIKKTMWKHLDVVDLDPPLWPTIHQLLDSHCLPGGGNFGAWIQNYYFSGEISIIEKTTPLYMAARQGLLPLVKMILKFDGTRDLEKPGGRFECTPLHVASWAGHSAIVAELLAAGADVHEQGNHGLTGLWCAMCAGHNEIEDMLREAGATLPKHLQS